MNKKFNYRHSQQKKAEIFDRFTCLEKSLNSWKIFLQYSKEKRRVEEERKEKEREETNIVKAAMYRERNLIRFHLDRWRGLAKLMARKRELRDLEKQKTQSRDRINVFLHNLQEAVKQSNKPATKPSTPVTKSPKNALKLVPKTSSTETTSKQTPIKTGPQEIKKRSNSASSAKATEYRYDLNSQNI